MKKQWEQTEVVKKGECFPIEPVSQRVHQAVYALLPGDKSRAFVLQELSAETLYTTQNINQALKHTLDQADQESWNPVLAHLAHLHEVDPRKQLRVHLVFSYAMKSLERDDDMPGVIPTVKRSAENVVVLGESPIKKKAKQVDTVTQFGNSQRLSATQLGKVAADTHQLIAESSGQNYVRELLLLYHCQLPKCDNQSKMCVNRGNKHFMFHREIGKLWNDAILRGEATVQSIPVELLHLVELRDLRDKSKAFGPGGPPIASQMPTQYPMAPQFIPVPMPSPYTLPPMAQWPSFPQGAVLGPQRTSSPPQQDTDDDLETFIKWFKIQEPKNIAAIDKAYSTLQEELCSLSNLRHMKEDRIDRLKLPSGLIDRMKASIKDWKAQQRS